MKHFFFLALALAALCGLPTAVHADSLASIFTNVQSHAGSPRRPSIIIIRCHGLGYGDLSCDGQTNYFTPNIDRLASLGMRFTSFHAGSADFTGALAALMTGKNGAFVPGSPTLADRLKALGYYTGLLGEWTLGSEPWRQGFDEFGGFITEDEGRDYYADHIWRFAPHSLYDPNTKTVSDFTGRETVYQNLDGKKSRYMPEVFLKGAVTFPLDHQPDKFNRHRPLFLLADIPAPRSAAKGAHDYPVRTDAPYSDAPWPQAAKNRAALLTLLDGYVGQLLDDMNAIGLTNNTAIIFCSSAPPEKTASTNLDFLMLNGPAPAADAAAKSLPMIVYWPGVVPPGQVSDVAWSNADILPTILELVRGERVPDLDGKSMVSVFRGEAPANSVEAPH